MKNDLDQLMTDQGIDAFIAQGSSEDTNLFYLTGGARVNDAIILKRRGRPPVFVYHTMERSEAGRSGLELVEFEKYDWRTMRAEEGDDLRTTVRFYRQLCREFGIGGTVAFYGARPPGTAYHLLTALQAAVPGLTVAYEAGASLIDQARMTKDADEIRAMRVVRDGTIAALDRTLDFIRQHRVDQNRLVKPDRSPVRIGDLRRVLRGALFEAGLVEGSGTIISLGADAGLPHSYGNDNDELTLGRTLLFDIFPKSVETGYYFDLTRTFCLGHAPDRVRELYDQVHHALALTVAALKPDTSARVYENQVDDYFERQNHATLRTDRQTRQGYVHSLGHGLGLNVHEHPYFGLTESASVLRRGHVFTVEPGLYYPDDDLGVRIEDVIYLDEAGRAVNLSDYPYEPVLEVGRQK